MYFHNFEKWSVLYPIETVLDPVFSITLSVLVYNTKKLCQCVSMCVTATAVQTTAPNLTKFGTPLVPHEATRDL